MLPHDIASSSQLEDHNGLSCTRDRTRSCMSPKAQGLYPVWRIAELFAVDLSMEWRARIVNTSDCFDLWTSPGNCPLTSHFPTRAVQRSRRRSIFMGIPVAEELRDSGRFASLRSRQIIASTDLVRVSAEPSIDRNHYQQLIADCTRPGRSHCVD